MFKIKNALLILFVGGLVILTSVLGSPTWTIAQAGYIDEPLGVIEDTPEGGSILFGEGKNGSVFFDDCTGKCVVKDGLPLYVNEYLDAIPGTVVSKAYIRTVDGDGNSINASYTICFDSPGNLYLFVPGTGFTWVAGSETPGEDVCHDASGEGVFVFSR